MQRARGNVVRWLFDSRYGPADRLIPRWIFLRDPGAVVFLGILFSSVPDQGPDGSGGGPSRGAVSCRGGAGARSRRRFWFAPSLFWASSSSRMLMGVMIVGLLASVVAFVNLWPRLSFLVCWVCFLSFVTATECVVELPVGRDAAGSRLSLAVLCAARPDAGLGSARARPRAPASFCCNGNGFASISSPAW